MSPTHSFRSAILATALLGFACASPPRPRSLIDLDRLLQTPAVAEARAQAPQSYAAAVALRRKAERLEATGDHEAAELVAQQATAAFERAFVDARVARAEQRIALAHQRLDQLDHELGSLEQQERAVSAEARDLEARAQVLQELVEQRALGPAHPAREAARLEAALSVSTQARLLCTAAKLVGSKRPELAQAITRLGELLSRLESPKLKPGQPVPLDQAWHSRTECLRELTLARRDETRKEPTGAEVDELLSALTQADGLEPFRDDRGVVIAVRGFIRGTGLTPEAEQVLTALGRTARAHPRFPLLLVLHGKVPVAQATKQLELVEAALRKAGAPKVESTRAGNRLPVVDPTRTGASERNTRIEVVFVAPLG